MKIKMKTSAAGPDGVFKEGTVYTVGDQVTTSMAEAFVKGGYAEDATKSNNETENASIGPDETSAGGPSKNKSKKNKK